MSPPLHAPDLPAHGWTVFELITPHGQDPYWLPRGGVVGEAPPDVENMKYSALQSSGLLVAVRYRLESETRMDVPFERDLPEIQETESVPAEPVKQEQGDLFA